MLGPSSFGTANWMAADESVRAERRRADTYLGRADVRHRAAARAGLEHCPHFGGELRDRGSDNRQFGFGDRLGERAPTGLDGSSGDRGGKRLRLWVVADHFFEARARGGKRDGRADQARADDCEPPHFHQLRLSP